MIYYILISVPEKSDQFYHLFSIKASVQLVSIHSMLFIHGIILKLICDLVIMNSPVSDKLSMDEDEIEVLKESCLHDLFCDSSKHDDWSSPPSQIQISNVFSLASQDPPPLDTNFNLHYPHHSHLSKQFDSEAILNNLPDNPSVSSTTTSTEAFRDVELEGEATKENEATSRPIIKNDDGSAAALENVNVDADAEITDTIEGGERNKSSSAKSGTTTLTTSDTVPLSDLAEVSSTTSDPVPPPSPPPPPSPAPVFKTDLSQFFSQKPRPPVASQGGQNVIPVTGRDGGEESELLRNTERKVLVRIPRDLRSPTATPPPPPLEQTTTVKRKRGRPKGSKNKKKPVPSFSLPSRCKRCVFLRKTRR